MKRSLLLFALLFCLFVNNLFAKPGNSFRASSLGYIGGSFGITDRQFGNSLFNVRLGGQFMYLWNDYALKFSYNKFTFFTFDNAGETDEKFHSLELSLGRIFDLSDTRRSVLEDLYIGAFVGASVNYNDFYQTEPVAGINKLSSTKRTGFPISVSVMTNLGSLFMSGLEYKYTILQNSAPSRELNFFINIKLFEL
jgi:hypothetical protein